MHMQSAIQSRSFKGSLDPKAVPGSNPLDAIEMMGASMPFKRNAEIYGEHEPAEYLYKVVSGAVRTYKMLADGRRQIGAFYMAGDVFGFESGDVHTFSAEAISDSRIVAVKRSALAALAARDNDVARRLWTITTRELQRVQEHLLALIKTAEERVVGFLLEMAERATADIRLREFFHSNRRHDAGVEAAAFEDILQRQGIDHRAEHAHVVGGHAIHAHLGELSSAHDVATADDHADADAHVDQRANLVAELTNAIEIETGATLSGEGLAGELQQNPTIVG